MYIEIVGQEKGATMKALTKSQIKDMDNAHVIGSLVWASGIFKEGTLFKWQLSDARNTLDELATRGIITQEDADRMYDAFAD